MSREFFDFNPITGITHYTEQDGEDTVVHTAQDVEPVVESAKRLANAGARDGGIKDGWWHIADIPPTVWLEIKQKYNCDIFTPDEKEFERFLQIVQRDYQYLKTTHKRIA